MTRQNHKQLGTILIAKAADDLIRIPQVVCCDSYIDPYSIDLLKRELGLEAADL